MAATLFGFSTTSCALRDGTVVEAQSNGSTTLTITQRAPVPSGTVTTVATITMGTSATTFAVPFGTASFAMATAPRDDGGDDVWLVGPRGDTTSAILVVQYRRTAAGAWTEVGRASSAIPVSAVALSSLTAVYVPGNVPTVFVVGRRGTLRKPDSTVFGTVDPRAITDSARPLFIESGAAPSWAPALSTLGDSPLPPTDAAPVTPTRIAVMLDQHVVVDVIDGRVTSNYRPPSGTTTAYSSNRVRTIGLPGGVVATVYSIENGASFLYVTFYSASGVRLAARYIDATDSTVLARGGLWGSAWDVYYNPLADELVLYFVGNSERTVRRLSIGASTYVVGAAANVSTTVGNTGATLSILRVQNVNPDERRIRIAVAQTLSGAESTQYLDDSSRNVAPLAPNLTGIDGALDAAGPIVLTWEASDPNPRDSQTRYDYQVQRVSDSVVVASGTSVVSALGQHTIPAGTLVNGVAYRYRVLTRSQDNVAGSYSAYMTFTPSAVGTVTITSPASNDPAGLNTATIPFAWTTNVPGGSPTGHTVKVFAVSGGALLGTYELGAAARSYNVPVPSGVRVRVEVTVTSAGGTSSAAFRTLTSNYDRPMPATPILAQIDGGVSIEWYMPALAGSRPATTIYVVERADPASGSSAFVPLYSVAVPETAPVGQPFTVLDYEVGSGLAYQYRVVAYASGGASQAGSTRSVTAPELMGVWLHLTRDPAGTIQGYPYAEGRKASHSVESEAVALIGRSAPVIEYGDLEPLALSMNVRIPHGVGTPPEVAWWEAALLSRDVLCYRDNRGRAVYVALQGFDRTDLADGTLVTVKLTRVPYLREPADAAA